MNKNFAVAVISSILCTSAYAESAIVAIGPRIGTQGIGLEVRTPITENVFARINGNYFSYKSNFKDGQVDYKGNLTLMSVPIMVDWHPIEDSGFRLSAGIAYNGNKLKATATPSKNITINRHTYTPQELGTVTAKLSLGSSIAGVASIGYDGSFINNGPLSFNFELGAMFTGKPKLKITSTGLANKYKEEDIKRDAKKSLNDIEKYLKIYPIISLGVKYAL